jgi:hypothetical protein
VTLEHDLRALADGFPDPPALAPRVMAAAQRARAHRSRRRRVALLAFAVFLLVPATALAVSSDLRDRVLETFGLRDVKITAVARLPELGAEVRRLELGPRISLEKARKDLTLDVGAPTVLGTPDGIFEERLESGVDITFLYEPRTVAKRIGVRRRVLVSIVRGTIDKTIIGKTVASTTRKTFLEIDGDTALLLTGAPHMLVLFRAPDGVLDQISTRLAGTTLLWQREEVLVRVEGELPRARLVAIARSVAGA